MRILIIAEKKKQIYQHLEELKERGVKATYLRVSKITLVSKKNKTLIKSLGKEVERHDAALIQTRTSLAPFIEPLLEELERLDTYTTAKKGAYFCGWNEPYQFTTLATESIPTPRTITSASPKNIEQLSKKISYPVIAKSFSGKKTIQSILINNSTELGIFAKSMKADVDAFMVREFIEGDVLSCIIIGSKVLAVKRKYVEGKAADIRNGKMQTLSDEETDTAIRAANACGFEIARVDMVNGKVIKVDPIIELEEFNPATSSRIESHVASFLIEKAQKHEKPEEISGLKKIIRMIMKNHSGAGR